MQANPNAIFLDIGANIGYYTLLAAKLGHRTIAVEPVDDQVKRIHKAVDIQNFKNLVLIVQNAMSDVRMDVVIRKSGNNQGDSRMDDKANATTTDQIAKTILLNDLIPVISEVSDLPTYPTSLYDSVKRIQINQVDNTPPSVIMKIDVQGFEHRIFANGEDFFDRNNVTVIIMEWEAMKYMHPRHENSTLSSFRKSPDDTKNVNKMIKILFDCEYQPYSSVPGTFGNLLVRDDWHSWPQDIIWCKKIKCI